MKKILNGIKNSFFIFIKSAWYIIIALLIAFLISWIYNEEAGTFTFLGIIFTVILYVWFRQICWFISGTGDYQGRNGFLKKLWDKIFKK